MDTQSSAQDLPAKAAAAAAAAAGFSAFVPLLLVVVTLTIWLAFQMVQLVNERAALAVALGSQQQSVDNAAKLRGSLDAIAADTQRLADSGNANAGLLVAELRKRGITINPNAPKPDAAASATR